MGKTCIWYLKGDGNELTPDLASKIKSLGFKIEEPTNKDEFLQVLSELAGPEIVVHIFAHGHMNFIAPYTQEDIDRMRDADEIVVPGDDKVNYSDMAARLTVLIAQGHIVIVNMMAVCNSIHSNLPAHLFLGFDGLNKDFRESLEVYPLFLQKLDELNARRKRQDGPYLFRIL